MTTPGKVFISNAEPRERVEVTCWSYLALAIDKPYLAGRGVIIHDVWVNQSGNFGYMMSNDWSEQWGN